MTEMRTGLKLEDVLRGQTSPHLASAMYLNEVEVIDPFQDAVPCFLAEQEPIRLLECGCCGQFHPDNSFQPGGSANYMNDCRYDANRFRSDEDFTKRTGLPCVEVWLDEQEEL